MMQTNELREQAWKYFELHAQQRLTAFNFFIFLATSVTAAGVTSSAPLRRCMAGVGLVVLSYLFWRLDRRTVTLTKMGEAVLRDFETADLATDGVSEKHLIFKSEEDKSKERKKTAMLRRFIAPVSYSEIFNRIFLLFLLIGLGMLAYPRWEPLLHGIRILRP